MQEGESDAWARAVLYVFLENISLNKLLHKVPSMSGHWLPRRRAAGASAEVMAGEKWPVSRGEVGFGEGSVGEGRRLWRRLQRQSCQEAVRAPTREVAAEREAEGLRRSWCEPVHRGTPGADVVMVEDEGFLFL